MSESRNKKNPTRYELIPNYYTANSSIHKIKGMFSFSNARVLNSLCAYIRRSLKISKG
jgi:hypothetical protein